MAFNDKYPVASTHVVVIPKTHVSKKRKMMDKNQDHWAKLMAAVFEVVRLKKLNETGFKLVVNGAGYNHFDHEHVHVLGGLNEPDTMRGGGSNASGNQKTTRRQHPTAD